MRFAFTEDQETLRAAARAFLADNSSSAQVRQVMETELGYDPEVWRRIGGELGWTSVIVPEAYGGAVRGPRRSDGGTRRRSVVRTVSVDDLPRRQRLARRRQRDAEAGAPARDCLRRDGGDAGLHRAKRPLGCRGDRSPGAARGRRVRARRRQVVRPRRPQRRVADRRRSS